MRFAGPVNSQDRNILMFSHATLLYIVLIIIENLYSPISNMLSYHELKQMKVSVVW